MNRILSSIIIFSLFVWACNDQKAKEEKGKWSDQERSEFIASCMEQGKKQEIDEATSKKYCDCMLDRFQQEFKSQQEATNVSLNELAQLSKGCVD
ncbi:MAG TPA: hypothetical protein VEX63_13705 [Flavisolibacter sp.]|nr:hypothetical protein [Flavisolibacter sp.]